MMGARGRTRPRRAKILDAVDGLARIWRFDPLQKSHRLRDRNAPNRS